jgi:hypothetical protein
MNVKSFAAVAALACSLAAQADSDPNDTARYLAGMSLQGNAPANPRAKSLDESWRKVGATRLASMRDFAAKHLGQEQQQCKTLFYPFSGPDALNALTLFPRCEKYVMFGLEPAGELPLLDKLDAKGKAAVLDDMQKAQDFIIRRNFFVTRYMQSELNTPHIKGVLPLMSATLVRMGYEIRDVRSMNVDGTAFTEASGKLARAVAIIFGIPGQKAQEIFYADFDASNDGLRVHPGFLHYMEGVNDTITVMKAASYLCHDNTFSTMRDLIESRSVVIVQDDSGLPYKSLKASGFDVELYGNYVGVIPVFSYRLQRDLASAYAQAKQKQALPFSWSYAERPSEEALQIARRHRA